MNRFDKFCAVLAFILGCVLLGLGVIGLFTGCRAYFTLPAVLGRLPALVGWGIVRAVVVAWRQPPRQFYADQTFGDLPPAGPLADHQGSDHGPPYSP
jgi:hypothetical protein